MEPPASSQFTPPSLQPTPSEQPIASGAAQPPSISNKSYVATWLLSLFLGTFGIDRFYLGRIWTGILKLITFGGLGLWALIDWWRIAFGYTKDKQGRPLCGYSKNQKVIKTISILILIAGLAIGFWQAFHTNNNSVSIQQNSSISSSLIEEKLTTVRLSFQYPRTWRVTSQDSSSIYLKSPDDFELGFLVYDTSAYNAIRNTTPSTSTATTASVKELVSNNNVGGAFVYADSMESKPYHSITVTKSTHVVGDTFNTGSYDLPTNPSVKGLYISINGGYANGFDTLSQFDAKDSVKQAKLIFQSMKYY